VSDTSPLCIAWSAGTSLPFVRYGRVMGPGMSISDHPVVLREARDGRWGHEPLGRRLRATGPLLLAWTRKEYSVRYRQNALGIGWSILQPLALLLIFGVILSRALHAKSDGQPYTSYAYCGLVAWTFVSTSLLASCQALLNASGIVNKVYFPREIVPLAQVTAYSIDLVINTIVLVGLTWFQGRPPTYRLIALVPIYLMVFFWTAAVAVFVAVVTVFVRDLRYGLPLLVQLGFIASPIMYSPAQFPHSVRWTTQLNPVAVAADGIRRITLLHRWPAWPDLIAQSAVALVVFCLVLAYVRSVEPRLVDVL
jgi:lipopolysaccharide transport system permease protein